MAVERDTAEKQLREITECPICMSTFTDPRMFPCIHTFCCKCLKSTGEAEQKKPGDNMPCPLCRKEFIIPPEGMIGLQRNFFMESLLEYKMTLQNNLPTMTIGTKTQEETSLRRIVSVQFCTKRKHKQRPLDFYCADCKKIVCVSCFVESHKLHDCKDVETFDEGFRQTIKRAAWKAANYADEILSLRNTAEMIKKDFLENIDQKETAIIQRTNELKNMIDKHSRSLLNELSMIKSSHLKEMVNQMEEIDRSCAIMRSFESYCSELRLKGSASNICSSFDQLISTADELEKDYEAFIGRPHQSVKVSFQETDLEDIFQHAKSNLVGLVEVKTDTATYTENMAVVVGLSDGSTATRDVVKINLHKCNEISTQEQIPTKMMVEAFAAVYCNMIYVVGIGDNCDEIWNYSVTYGWIKCASLVQGRRRHSAAFIEEVLYICGGFVDWHKSLLDSVEAYNAVADECTTVGKLVHSVKSSGNCVSFKSSIYIFGGADKGNNPLNHVQVYNTKDNTCSVLSRPMPRPYNLMRAVLWETSVILLGYHTCFIFNLETETWKERDQFKTGVSHFGLVLENERIIVMGGVMTEKDKGDKITRKCKDDVRYVPLQNILDDKPIEWKIHATLPHPSIVCAFVSMQFPVKKIILT